MLFIRIAPIYTKIFTDWPGDFGNFVNFAADDAVYHMRFVHNTLHHFPFRVFFDPFTHYPFGSYISFGPLFTLIVATASLIIGLGSPSPELINHVSAYIPPIMGALCLIPSYCITNKLFGKTTALLAAFILTFLPGEFLNRSSLGFVDHHIAEVLFSTTTCAFLIYALDTATNRTINGLLAGITFGLFTLVWQGVAMFGVIFLLFFITQLIIDHCKNNNTNYLLRLVFLTYLPPVTMVLPYILMHPQFNFTLYPLYITLIMPAMITIFIICYLWHCMLLKADKKTKYWLISAIIIVSILLFFSVQKYLPQVYGFIAHGYKLLFCPNSSMRTVGEVQSAIFSYNGAFTTQKLWVILFWAMPLTIIGLGCLVFNIYEKQRPAEVLLLIWTLAITIATCAQVRFSCYLAINTAILAALGIYYCLDMISYAKPQRILFLRVQKICLVGFLSMCTLLIVDPILMLLLDNNVPFGHHVSRSWYNTLMWLKKHTPNPQGAIINKNFDYTKGYYPIPKNLNSPYHYPKSAYGIMAWWDVGHQITYIAEHIPSSNNHQQGILEKNNTAGSAMFFTATSEDHAIKNLDYMGSRYVIITNNTANALFQGVTIWANDTEDWFRPINRQIKLNNKIYKLNNLPYDSQKFLQSITNRLFYNDADGLQHFRLIHESEGDYLVTFNSIILEPSIKLISNMLSYKTYNLGLQTMQKINHIIANKNGTIFAYSARPPVKDAKIFEKVKGAIIRGTVPNNITNNTPVNLLLKLKTKYNRIFTYTQTTKVINGKYQFVVAYPTTKMHGEGYSYDIQPIGNYRIKINNKISKVTVLEEDVMFGKVIKVS